MRHIIIIFTNALFKKKRSPSACVLVFLLVLVFRASSFENNAAIQEQLFERRRRKKKKKKRVLLFFFLVVTRKFPREHHCHCGEKNDDGQKVRARVGLEHRFSFLSSSMSRGEDRRHRFPLFASRSLVFFRATRFYAGERARLRAKVVAANSLSLFLSFSLLPSALCRNDDRMVSMTDHS